MLKTACHEKTERGKELFLGYAEGKKKKKKAFIIQQTVVWTGSYRVCGVLIVCDCKREINEWGWRRRLRGMKAI